MLNIEKEFLNFFKQQKHHIYSCANMISNEQSSTMFNVAGMQQFIPYFTEKETSPHKRIVTSQPCIRVGGKHCDIDDIGKTPFHLTFFKMLGNFSFQDYFKMESIEFAVKFLQKINIDFRYIYVTVYPEDKEAYNIWCKILNKKQIFFLEENIWSLGNFGPYGFCTEIFYDITESKTLQTSVNGMLEIWNIVFMEFYKSNSGTKKLQYPFIDTGMGLERITSIVERTFDVFKTTLIKPIFNQVKKYNDLSIYKLRMYSDHIRTACILLNENLFPGNTGVNYVVRNLIRKCYQVNNIEEIVTSAIDCLKLNNNVKEYFLEEINTFHLIIEKNKQVMTTMKNPTEKDIFYLKDTHGIPYDISMNFFNKSFNDKTLNDIATEKYTNTQPNNLQINYSESTKSLCHNSTECTGVVKYVHQEQDCTYIITNQTCFYPAGGGQPGDVGYMVKNKHIINVKDTIKRNISEEKVIIHVCDKTSIINTLDQVGLYVNKSIRQSRTRSHSAVHIMGDIIEKNSPYKVIGTSVGNDQFKLDVEYMNSTLQKQDQSLLPIDKIIKMVNQYILQNIPVEKKHENIHETNASRLSGVHYDNIVRTVKMGPLSYQLCGGTHVDFTGSIGTIILEKNSNLGSNKRRLNFICGEKSIDYILNNNHNNDNIQHTKTKKQVFVLEDQTTIGSVITINCQGDNNLIIKHYKKHFTNHQVIYYFNSKKGKTIMSFNCNNITDNLPNISKGGANNMLFLITSISYQQLQNQVKKVISKL